MKKKEVYQKFFSKLQLALLATPLEGKAILRRIERRTGMSRITIINAVKKLKELGLIDDEVRGRVHTIWLTEKGKKTKELLLNLDKLLTTSQET